MVVYLEGTDPRRGDARFLMNAPHPGGWGGFEGGDGADGRDGPGVIHARRAQDTQVCHGVALEPVSGCDNRRVRELVDRVLRADAHADVVTDVLLAEQPQRPLQASLHALGGTPLKILSVFTDTPRALAVSPDRNTVYVAGFKTGNQTTTIEQDRVCPGFKPATPHRAAGWRMDPPVSVPRDHGAWQAATAAAEPPRSPGSWERCRRGSSAPRKNCPAR